MDDSPLNLHTLASQGFVAQLVAELEQSTASEVTWTKEYAASGTSKTLPPVDPPTPPPPPPGVG